MPALPRLLTALLAAFLAAALGPAHGSETQEASPPPALRAPDAFYDPPAKLPSRPGVLLRSEVLRGATLPAGVAAWRILYTTTVDDETPATAAALVFAPADLPAGPRPVIAWQHGTTGLHQRCMPSLSPLPQIGIPAFEAAIAAGWVIVATDYQFTAKDGPHPYLIGEGEGRAALDSVRAARRMPELTLDRHAVVWGHSQGGHAALWAGIVGPRYAPDVALAGVAAIAPPTDLLGQIAANPAIDRFLGPYVAQAYGRFYPDVSFEDAVHPQARNAAFLVAGLCTAVADEARVSAALLTTFEGRVLATETNAALRARLAENGPDGPIEAPVLVAQGLADSVVLAPFTATFVVQRCVSGQTIEYLTLAGADHGGIVAAGSPLEAPLMEWTSGRFAGETARHSCLHTPE